MTLYGGVQVEVVSEAEEQEGFGVTAITKLKHADLWVVAKKLGSQKALAEHLGLTQTTVNSWINLRACPPTGPSRGRWTKKFFKKFEQQMLELTGKLLEELFPPELRENAKFLQAPKRVEMTRRLKTDALLAYAEATTERLTLEGPNELREINRQDLRDQIHRILATLSQREQEVIKYRFGLEGYPELCLERVADILEISGRRVKQIEGKAVRKMQQPPVAASIADFATQ